MFMIWLERKLTSVLLILLIVWSLISISGSATVSVHFLDVGQGDAIYIHSDAGADVLIDAGPPGAGRSVVVPYLQAQGVSDLDLVVATHPHADHIGGIMAVLKALPVAEFRSDGQVHTSRVYMELLELLVEMDLPYTKVEAGQEVQLPGIDRFVFLGPGEPMFPGLNNNSVVAFMQIGTVCFLFTGDIEEEAESRLLGSSWDLAAPVLKVPHHGSATSSGPEFLRAVSPEIAVICVGAGNRYGFPHQEVLERLAGTQIYRTDRDGTIVVTTDGCTLNVSTSAGDAGKCDRDLININIADKQTLMTLPGVGEVIAGRIISYRQIKPFRCIDDIKNVKGIGPKRFEAMKDLIAVE